MNTLKIVGLLFAAVLLGFAPALAIPAPPIYGSCYNAVVPSPAPTSGQATIPLCINGLLQTNATAGATPIPFPTFPWPVSLPTSFQTAFPTPIPFPTLGVNVQNTSIPVTPATTFPVSGAFPTPLALQPVSLPTSYQTAFPTPIPFPTLGVVCISGCATPIPFPTLGVNVLNTPTVNAGTGFPTPLAVQPVSGAFPTPLAIQPVSPSTVATPSAITTPASSATSVTLLAANGARNGWTVCNNSTQILYLAKAATVTTSAYTLPFPAAGTIPTCYIESGVSVYRGIITGIWASANGTAIVTEW